MEENVVITWQGRITDGEFKEEMRIEIQWRQFKVKNLTGSNSNKSRHNCVRKTIIEWEKEASIGWKKTIGILDAPKMAAEDYRTIKEREQCRWTLQIQFLDICQ